MKVYIRFVKSLMLGIEPHWIVLSEDKQSGVREDSTLTQAEGEEKEFDTYQEAKSLALKNRFEIVAATNISFETRNKVFSIYVDNALDATYQNVRNKKQEKELLRDDYGI